MGHGILGITGRISELGSKHLGIAFPTAFSTPGRQRRKQPTLYLHSSKLAVSHTRVKDLPGKQGHNNAVVRVKNQNPARKLQVAFALFTKELNSVAHRQSCPAEPPPYLLFLAI